MSKENNQEGQLYDKEKVDFALKGAAISEFKFYPDSPTLEHHKKTFVAKEASRFYDPCAESSRMAIRCMENNDVNFKSVCGEYFLAYRECKKAWMKQRREDDMVGRGW